MNHIARILFLVALGFVVGCQPSISEKDLGFLSTQKKPLAYQTVVKHLGDTEPGPGACYVYPIRGTKKTVEFWFAAPPLPNQATAKSIPVEIAVVSVREGGTKPTIIWPEDSKGKDFDEAMATIWPQRR